jgi:2-polyprenyl-3-methyl-5-hydroxy-6-metoxy-1,4-benzoquinol methylase
VNPLRGAWRGTLTALPFGPALRLVRSWLNVTARGGDQADALKRLFSVDDLLQGEIDQLAIRRDGGVHPKHRLTRYHDFFVQRVGHGERVLDVGCGKGELAHDLAELGGASVVGIDILPEKIAFARERFAHPRVEYVEADVYEFESGERFDAVVLSNVLEHLADRETLLRRIVDVARPARILIRVPAFDRHWHVPLRKELGITYFSDPTHETEYVTETLRSEVEAAGLELTSIETRWGELWAEARPRA